MFKTLKLLFAKETTLKHCHKCDHFSGNMTHIRFKKSFKWIRLKYWKFLFYKINLSRQGYCAISIINNSEDHEHLIMRASEECIFKEVSDKIIDTKNFIGKLPDDPEKMNEVIEQIESGHKQISSST